MKSSVVEEILNAVEKLSLDDEVNVLSSIDAAKRYTDFLETFVNGADRRWWWEDFAQPSFSVQVNNDEAFLEITKIVPDENETVWFMVEDDEMPYYPVLEGTPKNIQKIISECFAFEYYLIPKNKTWLLCEDHHNVMHGIGEEIISKLKQY